MLLLCELVSSVEERELRFRLCVVNFRSLTATSASASKADRIGVDGASELVAGCECCDEQGTSEIDPLSLWSAASWAGSAFVLMLEVLRSSVSESGYIVQKALETSGQSGTMVVYGCEDTRRHWRCLSRRGTIHMQMRCNLPHKLYWRC